MALQVIEFSQALAKDYLNTVRIVRDGIETIIDGYGVQPSFDGVIRAYLSAANAEMATRIPQS
jgi:hypothetical protein